MNEKISLIGQAGTVFASPVQDCEDLIRQLELSPLFHSRTVSWAYYLTTDIETILYRQEVFQDLLSCENIYTAFVSAVEQLHAINELHKLREGHGNYESDLYTIKEVELYVDFIHGLYESLNACYPSIGSRGIQKLYAIVSDIYKSDAFVALREGVSRLSMSVKDIKSVTIGINLDAALSPYESGLLAVHDSYFHSGDLISRFMRMEVKKDEMMTLAPLAVSGKKLSAAEKSIADEALQRALNKFVGDGFRNWRKMLHQYFSMNTTPFLALEPELQFLIAGTNMIRKLKEQGLPFCSPEACPMEEKRFKATGLYNPALAESVGRKVVCNDFSFDENGMLYILTGPNRGGKSVLLHSVGIAQLMFQLGLPVAAKQIEISPVDHIFTHFPSGAGSTVGKGRFGEECLRLKKMLQHITPHSMILMDETFSGTDSYEASSIAEEVMTALSIIGCRGIFATHLHQICQFVPDINAQERMRSKVDYLVAEMVDEQCTFRVMRRNPDGKSYARNIAERYGLSLDEILREVT